MKAPEVRGLSFAAKGLWIDMLCLMFESPRRGYLQTKTGQPVSLAQLARMTGGATDEVSHLLQELDNAGVYSTHGDGTIYSRRMVRDERKRNKCAEAGRRGGGNPTFKGSSKGHVKGGVKGAPKGSPEVENENERRIQPKVEDDIPERLRTPEFRAAWNDWLVYRKARKPALPKASQIQKLKELEAWGPERAIRAIRHSIGQGWQGVFEPKNGTGGNLYQGLQDFANGGPDDPQ